MDEATFFLAKLDLLIITERINNSLTEIKEKSPNRIDYIEPMTKSINQLLNVSNFIDKLQIELETSRQRNIDLENINLIRLKEIQDLKNQIKIDNLDL